MVNKIVCPKNLFDLFKTHDEKKLRMARGLVIKLIQDNIADLPVGGEIVFPDPATGDPVSWTKHKDGTLTQ